MSELWKRKMKRFFVTFDFDKDGFLSKDDLIGMAIQFSKFGKPEKHKVEHLKAQFENVWRLLFKHADAGNRDSITVDHLTYSIGKQRHDPELMKYYTAIIGDLHDMLDMNRDGYLQEDEYERMMFQMGSPDTSFVKMAFNAIDVNGDGKLSLEEFINAFFDFLFSDDESSPNRFFFGPLDN